MLITINDVSKSFGSDDILKKVDLRIHDNSKIGLIGLNGSGKSTLLKIIAGDLPPDSGSVVMSNSVTVGFLRQNLGLDENETIYEETLKAFSNVIEKEKQEDYVIYDNLTEQQLADKLNRSLPSTL